METTWGVAGAAARREYERRRDLDRGRMRQGRTTPGGVADRRDAADTAPADGADHTSAGSRAG